MIGECVIASQSYLTPEQAIAATVDQSEEIERLETENAKLRELVCRIWNDVRLMDANRHIKGMRLNDIAVMEYKQKFAELGIEVES